MKELDPYSVESSELVEQTFNFWLNDNQHIRSPFPHYIHAQLKVLGVEKFFEWVSKLDGKAKDEVNDEILAEKFEEIIFEIATNLVLTEDEKLTILYPFLPRLADKIFENAKEQTGESEIVDREMQKEGDHSFMKVKLKKIENGEVWETQFELPL